MCKVGLTVEKVKGSKDSDKESPTVSVIHFMKVFFGNIMIHQDFHFLQRFWLSFTVTCLMTNVGGGGGEK